MRQTRTIEGGNRIRPESRASRPADWTDGPETRFNAIGRNAAGRHLFIVFAVREVAGERLIRPISARYMHGKEVIHYERETRT
jgi:uncharacterized DUF497 family protein